MPYIPDNPLIVQSDLSLLLETMGPRFEPARDALARFADLVKSPDYVHTWRITPLSLWNAAAAGYTVEQVLQTLRTFARYDVPPNVPTSIRETMGRYGRLRLMPGEPLVLEADDLILMAEIRAHKKVRPHLGAVIDELHSQVLPKNRGVLKQALIAIGHPVRDQVGFADGDHLDLELADGWAMRDYQVLARDAFLAGSGTERGGSGVIVLPCGAGKTIVGLSAIAALKMRTLIICTSTTALRQWRDEIIERTTLTAEEVGEYSGEEKVVAPITLTTYQMVTHRREKGGPFLHFALFDMENWGLVIYDEVHLLPAPVFRTVAQLQARRRMGLTATLVREDGHEGDVFALIGPKRFDVPWKDLETDGWIATARCTEVRIPLPDGARMDYALGGDRDKYRIAATNPAKTAKVRELLARHPDERILIIGMYIDQLQQLAQDLDAPLIMGQTRQAERDAIFTAFRDGELPVLVISKVGNYSVDLPDASVLIQVSGTWGSRQEEAQRLGRILRPKSGDNNAWFYTIVTRDTLEQDYGERRQLFLTEQGYRYTIEVPQ